MSAGLKWVYLNVKLFILRGGVVPYSLAVLIYVVFNDASNMIVGLFLWGLMLKRPFFDLDVGYLPANYRKVIMPVMPVGLWKTAQFISVLLSLSLWSAVVFVFANSYFDYSLFAHLCIVSVLAFLISPYTNYYRMRNVLFAVYLIAIYAILKFLPI